MGTGLIFPIYLYKKKLLKSFCKKPLHRIQCNLTGIVTFYQDCSSFHDTSKNMAPRGGGAYFPYISV